MNNSTGAPSQEGKRVADNDCGHESSTDESGIIPHPRHQLARSVTSILRTISLFLLVGGVTGTILWRFDFRQPGALHGSASVVVGVMIGGALAAALIAALAFVVDLLFRIDWDAKFVPVQLEESA
jgi:hypothetical protein